MNQRIAYLCPLCGSKACTVGEAHMAGGFWSKVFDVEGRKFTTVTCNQCKHTNFFQTDRRTLGNVFDFFVT